MAILQLSPQCHENYHKHHHDQQQQHGLNHFDCGFYNVIDSTFLLKFKLNGFLWLDITSFCYRYARERYVRLLLGISHLIVLDSMLYKIHMHESAFIAVNSELLTTPQSCDEWLLNCPLGPICQPIKSWDGHKRTVYRTWSVIPAINALLRIYCEFFWPFSLIIFILLCCRTIVWCPQDSNKNR